MKVVINACFGGFSISKAAAQHMAAAGHKVAAAEVAQHDKEVAAFRRYKESGEVQDGYAREKAYWDISLKYGGADPKFHGYGYAEGIEDDGYRRDDPLLVAAVEALGKAANGEHAALRIVEIPDGIEWEIDEYDGSEHIAEKHRTWA